MAKGAILKAALLSNSEKRIRNAVLQGAILGEMLQYKGNTKFKLSLSANELCSLLAPMGIPLTPESEKLLHEFADYLEAVDTNPNALPNRLLRGKTLEDLIGL